MNLSEGQLAELERIRGWACCLEPERRFMAEVENAALKGIVAIILCWKPEWVQTSYFQKLPEKLVDDLVELAKSTKSEGSGGIDDEWLDALLADTQE